MAVETWNSDWQERFRSLVQRLGHDDAFELVMSREGESFGEVFGSLRRAAGTDDSRFLALRQLEEAFYVDAQRKGKLREAFMEALARTLCQYLRHGWNRGKRLRERHIDARTRWPTPSFVSYAGWEYDDWKKLQQRTWDEIESIRPPDDWCPSDNKDPILQEVFSQIWPDSDGGE
jgi:hypothetical protein